ncbi:MAG: hypothetical protein PHR42_01470 [Caldisericia bacterium]|nr:hypothetical protein [Caldisericia bacterium]
MDKKIVLLLIIFFLLLGSVVGILFEKKFSSYRSDLIENYEEENREFDCEENQNCTSLSSLAEEIYQIDGTIIEIGDKFIIVEALLELSRLPLPEEEITEKQNIKIYISEETEIFLIEPVGSVLEEDSESFESFIINFEDLEINDHVFVSSEENIKDKEEFIAKKIQVIKKIEIITPEG